jgi:hypothetical protein
MRPATGTTLRLFARKALREEWTRWTGRAARIPAEARRPSIEPPGPGDDTSLGKQSSSCRASTSADRTHGRYRADIMVYEVLVHSSGGARFTIERDASLADGDTFEQDSDSYRVLAIQPGHGPFDGVIEAEWLASSEPGAPA